MCVRLSLTYGSFPITDEQRLTVFNRYFQGLNLTIEERKNILAFLNDSSTDELALMPGCSRKSGQVIGTLRPFSDMTHLINRLSETRHLTPSLIDSCKEFLQMRASFVRLLQRCERLSEQMQLRAAVLMRNPVALGQPTEQTVACTPNSGGDDAQSLEAANGTIQLVSQQPSILNPL